MGTIASSRIVYGNAELIEENGMSNETIGVTDFKYANEGATEEISVNVPSTNDNVSVVVEKGASKKGFNVIPLVTGGALAYLAHYKFKDKKYTWAYVLGGFAVGYFGGSFVSNKLIK